MHVNDLMVLVVCQNGISSSSVGFEGSVGAGGGGGGVGRRVSVCADPCFTSGFNVGKWWYSFS